MTVQLTLPLLRKMMPLLKADTATLYLPAINKALVDIKAETPMVAAAFFGNVSAETCQCTMLVEGWHTEINTSRYTDAQKANFAKVKAAQENYDKLTRLGNTIAGDGYTYRGRGALQITGRRAYIQAGNYLGMDLVTNPDIVATDPVAIFGSAVWYWNTYNLTPYAAAGKFNAVIHGINNGNVNSTAFSFGADQRVDYYTRYLFFLGGNQCDDTVTPIANVSNNEALQTAAYPLLFVQQLQADLTRKNVNASPAPTDTEVPGIPDLPVMMLPAWTAPSTLVFDPDTAYPQNQFTQVTTACVQVDGQYVEKFAAYDFLLLRSAASKAGFNFRVVNAYRSWEDQAKLFQQRKDPKTRRALGYANPPGWGEHCLGTAIDLNVGLSITNYLEGATNTAYAWLQANAGAFGFVGDAAQPWHWEHLGPKIYSSLDSSPTVSPLFDLAATAQLAVDQGQVDYVRLLNRDQYEQSMAFSRSAQMAQSSRATLLANGAAFNLYNSVSAGADVGRTKQLVNSVQPPTAFDSQSIKPYAFNFTTGKWGDEA